jgi:hypothetical protein
MKLRGYFHPAYVPKIMGLGKEGGDFWIGFLSDDDLITDGLIRIELTVPADESDSAGGNFASFHVHYDGLKVIRKLEEIGFLDIFEEIKASTFYDVVQCCARCDLPMIYHGYYGEELMSRKMYELLHPTN